MRTRAVAATIAAFVTLGSPAAVAKPTDVDSEKLRQGITRAELTEHLSNLQAIADANGGTRATGTPGYEASVAYVRQRLEAAGYRVRLEPFNYPTWRENSPPALEQVTPDSKTYTPGGPDDDNTAGVDFITFEFSASGNLAGAAVVPTNDIVFSDTANTSTSGCEPEDFPSTVRGNVALIQRGTCPFVQKLENAETAGATGVILFNEGQAGRTNALYRTAPPDFGIPAVHSSFAVGKELYDAYQAGENPTVNLRVDAETIARYFDNVVADTPRGDPNKVVLLGAHLDSVPEGPGINDNGSGTAALLEIAEQLARGGTPPRHQIRFAFWGAEEAGLIGSTYYAEHLSEAEAGRIMLNLNFDMLASPNYVRFVYDGDGSATPAAGPEGSARIEQVFLDYFASQGLATEPTAFDGRSDYGPFIARGIPAGGLFTGAEGIKTPEQEAVYGGAAGEQYDPCYHAACDTFSSVMDAPPPTAMIADPANAAKMQGGGIEAFDQMADAAAHATWYFARIKDPLRTGGKKGKPVATRFKGHKRVQR